METMNFSNETLNAAVNAIKESQEEIKNLHELAKNSSINEVAQRYLMEKLSITQTEAEEVVENIQKGIDEFKTLYQANSENEQINLRFKLEEITAKMEEKQRMEYLNGVLTALQLAAQDTTSKEQVSELLDKNSKLSSSELIDEIERLASDAFPIEKMAEFIDKGINADVIIDLAHQIDMNKNEYCFLTALMLYTQQYESKIKFSDSENPLPASLIGSLACAGIESIIHTGELKEGKIDLKRWQTILKYILGALLGCTLFFTAIIVNGLLISSVIAFVLSIFGTSAIAIFVAMAIAAYACWGISDWMIEGIEKVMSILSGVYDQYIEPVTQKIKHLAESVKNWFTNLLHKNEAKTEKPQTEENSVSSTVTVQPAGVIKI